jgi:hypothetical protein
MAGPIKLVLCRTIHGWLRFAQGSGPLVEVVRRRIAHCWGNNAQGSLICMKANCILCSEERVHRGYSRRRRVDISSRAIHRLVTLGP